MFISSLTRFATCKGKQFVLSPLLSSIKPARPCLSLFSTAPATTEARTDDSESTQQQQQPIVVDVRSQLPKDFTPGHVIFALNQVGKDGADLAHQDFRLLLESARPNYQKDARNILTALQNYKRINQFTLDVPLAEDCIDQILSSDVDRGGLTIIENFTMKSGLYYSASLPSLHKALQQLLEVGASDGEEEEEAEKMKEKIKEALPTFIQELLLRRSRPYQRMKKRAKARYLKQIQIHQGPNQETIELLMKLGLEVSNNDVEWVDNKLVKPCLDQNVKVEEEMILPWNAKVLSHAAEQSNAAEQPTDDVVEETNEA